MSLLLLLNPSGVPAQKNPAAEYPDDLAAYRRRGSGDLTVTGGPRDVTAAVADQPPQAVLSLEAVLARRRRDAVLGHAAWQGANAESRVPPPSWDVPAGRRARELGFTAEPFDAPRTPTPELWSPPRGRSAYPDVGFVREPARPNNDQGGRWVPDDLKVYGRRPPLPTQWERSPTSRDNDPRGAEFPVDLLWYARRRAPFEFAGWQVGPLAGNNDPSSDFVGHETAAGVVFVRRRAYDWQSPPLARDNDADRIGRETGAGLSFARRWTDLTQGRGPSDAPATPRAELGAGLVFPRRAPAGETRSPLDAPPVPRAELGEGAWLVRRALRELGFTAPAGRDAPSSTAVRELGLHALLARRRLELGHTIAPAPAGPTVTTTQPVQDGLGGDGGKDMARVAEWHAFVADQEAHRRRRIDDDLLALLAELLDEGYDL